MEDIKRQLSFLSPALVQELIEQCEIKEIPGGIQILREEQYIKVLPVVLRGLVRVMSRFDDRELLLYYIQPKQSCVMTFTAAMRGKPSKVHAITEEESVIMLIPVEKLPSWLRNFPEFNELFYEQYDLRYTELLDTIQHVLINKMDRRLFDYLKHKSEIKQHAGLKISHSQIAQELGTAREVISRVMKKLEIEGKIQHDPSGIKVGEW